MSNIHVLIDDRKVHDGARTYYEHNKELFTQLNQEGWGVYFAVNDFGENARQDQYCIRLRYAYGDLDIAKAGDGTSREEKEIKKKIVIDALIKKCEPSFIIDTSNGIQPLWKLSDGDINKKVEYVNAIKGIIEWSKQYGCKADKVYDLARILRKPEYFHQKEEPYLCKIVHNSNKVYTIDELNKAFPYISEPEFPIEHKFSGTLSPLDEAIQRIDIQNIVINAYSKTGRVASFDNKGRVILDGRLTGTFQGKKDSKDYIASSSHEPIQGNRITVVADILGITNKEARKWLIDEYQLKWATEKAKLGTIKETKPTKDYKLRYTWGTNKLDDKFAIIKRKTFIIIAAKRGSGKTTFAFDMACKNALLGHKVLFISLEMEKDLIKEDFARRRAGITIPEERDYKIPELKQSMFERKIKEIDSIENLYFSGVQRGSNISWDGIKILISEYKDLDLIIIDNLDLIDKNEGEEENDKQKRIMKNIMNYTSDIQVPIILIHHYRKTQGTSKGHGMDELSGSGKIADSADYVVKVSRSPNPEAVYPEKYMSNIWLQKARGYNESSQDIFFLGGTFVDDAPTELNPALEELDKEFGDEPKVEPLVIKPYKDDPEESGLPF